MAEQAARETTERLEFLYGKAGVNYDIPMFRHDGRRYRALAATQSNKNANAFMGRTPGAAVLAIADGLVVMVDENGHGELI